MRTRMKRIRKNGKIIDRGQGVGSTRILGITETLNGSCLQKVIANNTWRRMA